MTVFIMQKNVFPKIRNRKIIELKSSFHDFAISVVHILPQCKPLLKKGLRQEFYLLNNRCQVKGERVVLNSDNPMSDFYGTSENAIYLQIWIAICTYLLLAYAKKVMHIEQSLHTISKNVGLFLTDKTHLNELFNKAVPKEEPEDLWYPSLFKPDDF